MSTYTTLKSRLGVDLKDIDMLVIGTGDDMNPDENLITEQVNKWNLI
jgi:F420-dependent methylenetetrahydromethanopterin dehydrogenase